MILIQTGNCTKCGIAFGSMDTIQSTEVKCSKCKKTVIVCRTCKEKGCNCGGRLLDAWEQNPGFMF